MKFRTMAVVAGALALFPTTAGPAKAALRLCNRTSSRVGVALGYKDAQGWATEGWWTIDPTTDPDPSKCAVLYNGDLIARYYYIFAVDYEKGGSWGGKAMMCIREKVFTIRGINDCESRGYKKMGFFEVDTGEEADWTVSLQGEKTTPGTGQ